MVRKTSSYLFIYL